MQVSFVSLEWVVNPLHGEVEDHGLERVPSKDSGAAPRVRWAWHMGRGRALVELHDGLIFDKNPTSTEFANCPTS